MEHLKLRLFITGRTPQSVKAIANLRELCDKVAEVPYDLDVIDVLERPQLAEDERIIATPTLIRDQPLPFRRMIGDLSDKEKVLVGLELNRNGET